jgi:hypothetical protein
VTTASWATVVTIAKIEIVQRNSRGPTASPGHV